jgi:hypothetical protein
MIASFRALAAIAILPALSLAALAADVDAQPIPDAQERHGAASSPDREPRSYRMAALRDLSSVPVLEARDAVLTRRMRAYGFGIAATGALVTAGIIVSMAYGIDYCDDDCDGPRREWGRPAMLALISVGAVALAVGIPGLLAAGARRRAARQRIRTLTLTPTVSLSQRANAGGAMVQLTW